MSAFTDRPLPAKRAFGPRALASGTLRAVSLLAALVAPGLLQAATHVTAQLAVQGVFAGGTGPLNLLENDEVLASLTGTTTAGADTFAAGTVTVQHGVIKLQGEFGGSGSLGTRGIFRDGLTVTAAGVAPGTPVDVTFEIEVQGDLQVGLGTGIGAAGWTLQADLGGGATDLGRRGDLINDGLGGAPVFTGSQFGVYEATVRLAVGVQAPLFVQLEGAAQAAYNGTGVRNWGSFDLGNSLYWGGITQVSVAGQALTDYALTSASGTDYRFSMAPVPEPGGVALMLAGLALLGWRQSTRRQRDR